MRHTENNHNMLTMNKRGASPLIATTILVTIVVIAVSIFTFWGKGYIKDVREKAGVDIEKLNCNSIQLSVTDIGGSVSVANNGPDLSGVAVHVFGDGEPYSTVYPQHIQSGSSKLFPYTNVPGVTDIRKVNVIPLLGAGINRPCSDQRIELTL